MTYTFALGACAHLPPTGVPATGEPLRVDVWDEHHQAVVKEKIGEVHHTDSAGNSIGTSTMYQDRVVNYRVTRWKTYQGGMPTYDEDFYRIAGDAQAANEISASRRTGVTMNRVGLGLTIGGGAVALLGVVLPYAMTSTDPTTGISTTPSWPYYLATFGGITLVTGLVLTIMGVSKTHAEHPINDSRRAMIAADSYNSRLVSVPPPPPPALSPPPMSQTLPPPPVASPPPGESTARAPAKSKRVYH